jgi:hypothetical protein
MGSSLTESAPEIPRHVRQIRRLIKFGPRNSIWVALLATNAELPLIAGQRRKTPLFRVVLIEDEGVDLAAQRIEAETPKIVSFLRGRLRTRRLSGGSLLQCSYSQVALQIRRERDRARSPEIG